MPEAKDRSYESIAVGEASSFQVEITSEMVAAFASLSGDQSPLHTDDTFGAASTFGHTLPHGMIAGMFFSRLVGMELPGKRALYLGQTLRFAKPLPHSTVVVQGVVMNKTDATRMLTIETTVKDAAGEVVVRGEALVRVQEFL